METTDDSESLDVLDECDNDKGCCCACCGCCWVNLIRDTFIFGDGVNDDAAVPDGSLLLLDDKFLVLHELLLLLLLPAFRFIRLSFCTLFLTK